MARAEQLDAFNSGAGRGSFKPTPGGALEKFHALFPRQAQTGERPVKPHVDIDYEGNAVQLTPEQKAHNKLAEAAGAEWDSIDSAKKSAKAAAEAAAKSEISRLGVTQTPGRAPRVVKNAAQKTRGVDAGLPTMPPAKFANETSKAHRLLSNAADTLGSINHPVVHALISTAREHLNGVKEGNLGAAAHITEARTHLPERGAWPKANSSLIKGVSKLNSAREALDNPLLHEKAREHNLSFSLPDLSHLQEASTTSRILKPGRRGSEVEFGSEGRIKTNTPKFEALKEAAPEGSPSQEKLNAAVARTPRFHKSDRAANVAPDERRRTALKKASSKRTIDISVRNDANKIGRTPGFDATSAVSGGDEGMRKPTRKPSGEK